MPTECSPDFFGFEPVEGHAVIAAFDAGAVTSDAGALLLGATDRTIRKIETPSSAPVMPAAKSSCIPNFRIYRKSRFVYSGAAAAF